MGINEARSKFRRPAGTGPAGGVDELNHSLSCRNPAVTLVCDVGID